MPNPLRGNGSNPKSPQEAFDPFEPLASQINQLEAYLDFAFEDYSDLLSKMSDRVLALPPEERFTSSIHTAQEVIEDELGSVDVFRSNFPMGEDQLISLLDEAFKQIMGEILSGILVIREPDDHLLLVSAMQELRLCIDIAYDCKKDAGFADSIDKEQLFSTLTALWARIYSIRNSEEASFRDKLAIDTVRAFYFRTDSLDSPQMTDHPDALSDKGITAFIRKYGAVIAYAGLDISVSRGAELAEIPPREFRELLEKRGVEIRYGPESVEDLNSDSMLHER